MPTRWRRNPAFQGNFITVENETPVLADGGRDKCEYNRGAFIASSLRRLVMTKVIFGLAGAVLLLAASTVESAALKHMDWPNGGTCMGGPRDGKRRDLKFCNPPPGSRGGLSGRLAKRQLKSAGSRLVGLFFERACRTAGCRIIANLRRPQVYKLVSDERLASGLGCIRRHRGHRYSPLPHGICCAACCDPRGGGYTSLVGCILRQTFLRLSP